MRPLTVLTGIVLGSTAATTFSLLATLVVFVFLDEEYPQFRAELPGLVVGTAAVAGLTALAALSFIGEIRTMPWRRWAQAALWLAVAVLTTAYLRWRL